MYRGKVSDKVIELKKIMREVYPGVKVPTFTIDYSLNSSKTLGRANHVQSTMSLNEKILNEFGDLYIDEIVVHEFAHFVVKALYPFGMNSATRRRVMPHGKEFKKVCAVFGISGKSTTNLFSESKVLEEKKSTLKRHPYHCGCRIHEVSTRKHNLIQNKNRVRICKLCKGQLKLAS